MIAAALVEASWRLARNRLQRRPEGLAVLGISGAQGSGKSTLAAALLSRAGREGVAAAALSLDDFYLTRAERRELAASIHPLLATRGVPGTHDVRLGMAVLDALADGRSAALPRFSKADDDRLPESRWDRAPAGCRLLILEGWCLGARPQPAEELRDPVNALEAREDPQGIWRGYANRALAGSYQQLFARIDGLALLAAPGFEVVFGWRLQQERQLAGNAPAAMDEAAVARFIQHYERLTRHILRELPPRADLLVRLGEDRRPLSIAENG